MTGGLCYSDPCAVCNTLKREKMTTSHEELAVMNNVTFGLDDRNRVSLRFTVSILSGSSDLIIFTRDEIFDLIESYNVTDIKNLNGRACIVVVDNGIVKFKGLY